MNPRDFAFAGFSLFMMGMTLSSSQKLESRSREVTMLNHEIELHKTEAQVLRDQMADMAYQFSSQKTYEEGVADGVDRSKNEDWVAGYHFCCEQFGMGKDLISKNK